jgi:hypothetical protein
MVSPFTAAATAALIVRNGPVAQFTVRMAAFDFAGGSIARANAIAVSHDMTQVRVLIWFVFAANVVSF